MSSLHAPICRRRFFAVCFANRALTAADSFMVSPSERKQTTAKGKSGDCFSGLTDAATSTCGGFVVSCGQYKRSWFPSFIQYLAGQDAALADFDSPKALLVMHRLTEKRAPGRTWDQIFASYI
jgi:hypothetical protein